MALNLTARRPAQVHSRNIERSWTWRPDSSGRRAWPAATGIPSFPGLPRSHPRQGRRLVEERGDAATEDGEALVPGLAAQVADVDLLQDDGDLEHPEDVVPVDRAEAVERYADATASARLGKPSCQVGMAAPSIQAGGSPASPQKVSR